MASVEGIHHRTDQRTGAVDRIAITDPQDWNARLHVVNGSPLAQPYPRDREFWIVTDEGEAQQVAYYADASWWMRREIYARTDGESGSWEPDEILGWSDSHEDAEEAAELYLRAG